MLASAGQQLAYEEDVPHAFIPVELIEVFVTDLYHPKAIQFVDAFSESELKNLAHLYGLLCAASDVMKKCEVHSVSELQKLHEWREVMRCAKQISLSGNK